MDTVRYSWKRDGYGSPWIFQKELTLSGNSYYKKEEGGPYSFAQMSVQKIREMDTKGVDSQKVSVPAHNPPKLCFFNTVKKNRAIESTLSRISLFWMQAQYTRIHSVYEGGGVWGSGPQTEKHRPQRPLQINFFIWRHFALPSMSLSFYADPHHCFTYF